MVEVWVDTMIEFNPSLPGVKKATHQETGKDKTGNGGVESIS